MNKPITRLWALPMAALGLAVSSASAQTYKLEDGFEQSTLSTQWVIENATYDTANVSLQSNIARTGQQSLRIVNNYSDTGSAKLRTEITAGSRGLLKWEDEYWVGFSFYPKNWTTSSTPEIVHQTHGIPNNYNWSNAAGRNLTTLYIKDGVLSLKVITVPYTGAAPGGASGDTVWSEPLQSDTWQDWVLHVRPSQNSTGLIEAWKDGVLIFRQNGPNVDPYDSSGLPAYPRHYLKIGVYNWPWASGPSNVSTREIFYDEVRIGEVAAGYSAGYLGVAPNGGAITFEKAGDVSSAFPSGVIQGGASFRGFDSATNRMKVYAQSTSSDYTAINANACSATKYSGSLNFIPEGRVISFNDVSMAIQSSGTTNMLALGLGNAASGNFMASSGPSEAIYFCINRNAANELQLVRKGQAQPLASWSLPAGTSWNFDYMSLALTAGSWAANILISGQSTPLSASGSFTSPYTSTTWGGNYHICVQATQTSTSNASTSRYTDGRVGAIEISPLP